MYLIDSHCHLDFAVFAPFIDKLLEESQQLGVHKFVLAGVSRANWPRLIQLSQLKPSCYFALGLHPYFLAEHQPQDLNYLDAELGRLKNSSRLVAVGEIGLDFQLNKNKHSQQQQEFYFVEQLKLAQKWQLPVILHVRKAHAQVLAILKGLQRQEVALVGGIVHAFNASYEQALEYKKLNFLLGIGGAYTWPKATKLRALLPRLPLEQLVLETDSPDMPPAFAPEKPNSPLNLPAICQEVAQILQLEPQQLAAITTANLRRLLAI